MLRVAQVVTRFVAGAGGVALRGALTLDPARYAVTVLAADGGSLLGEAEAAGLAVVRLRHLRPDLAPAADLRALHELSQRLGERAFDVVHTHSAKAGALGRLAAHRLGVPAIVHTLHGFPFHEFQSPLRRRAYLAAERRLGRLTDYFCGVGAAVSAEAVRLGIAPAERIRAIASAIDPTGLRPPTAAERGAARRLLGVPDGARVVGTVGRLDPQKAPADMVAAIAHLDRGDVHFVWVGGGPLAGAVRRLAAERGLTGRFHLLGERADVSRLLPGLDVFAMASLYEGLPCAVVEAISAGVPVVATAVNSVHEVVVPGRTGLLVRPGAPRELARALAHALDHPEEAARMAAAARVLIGERFLPAGLGSDLEDVYALALAHRRAGRAGLVAAGSR
jgi:glycosyltransferase involved in cell wall biosynthesis